ncbi:vitellogenin-3-like [Anastrepha obliqua]|uniref:vitellogenin-3-like n=1 Tax=Anastrepha obliqua TaxID=95512 RepID=UPI00240A3894|nr:vitellogenin-3-like [Anastrepha obliqua]
MSRFHMVVLVLTLLVAGTRAVNILDVILDVPTGIVNSLPKSLDIQTVGNTVENTVRGIGNTAANLIPTPQDVFDTSKNLLAGYPFELMSSAVHEICSAAIAGDAITPLVTPDLTKMKFQLRTACNSYSYPVLKANEIWQSPEFDPKKKVVIFASGWKTTIESSNPINELAKAFNCRGDVNFVAVDVADSVDTLYAWSSLNTDAIGAFIAEGLEHLTDVVPLQNIHLIGHGLGAHIFGAASRYYSYNTGRLVPRITGLDPAKPCFKEGYALSGLMRGDAEFIDVIHSNPGVMGKREPLGDVDFYPGGLHPLPTGCFDVFCAHARAWEYYAETVYPNSERNFLAHRCNSLSGVRHHTCPRAEYTMGYEVPRNLKGNYFLEVNGQKPFGVNGNARQLYLHSKCGLCAQRNF